MKLSQLTESFVISNDEFEDYLNRTTEQLAQELQTGKNARDAIHDLALTFAAQHNKSYDAYMRMSDALTARMHTLELDGSASTDIVPADTMNEPMADIGDEMGDGEPEMMTDPMGDMEMDTPADDEMPSDGDMDDYAAVMDNEPEAEEMGESVVNEASCGCCGNDPCDCDDSCDCKKVDESFVSESAMDTINQIVADKQAGKLHGMTVDMFTASAIKQIYDVVNDNNKAKLDDLMSSKEGVLKAANMAMKMMSEGKYKSAAQRKAVHAAKAEKTNEVDVIANKIMHSSTRASFSEYNEFYKELDKAAKAGKKAGDTISVGGKNIKLKSNPKQMHQLSDSDMDKIDALAQRLNEKGCSSKMKK